MVRAHFRPLVSHQCVFRMFSFGQKCSPENVSSTIAFAYRFYLSTCFRMEMHAKTITKRRVRFQKCSLSSILEKRCIFNKSLLSFEIVFESLRMENGWKCTKKYAFRKEIAEV